MRPPQIIVIGAGLAGLTAAYRLQEKGHAVQVYEARHRPGGRVLTANIGESYEELGGKNFLDAGEPTYTLQLLQDLKVEPLFYQTPYKPFYIQEGRATPLFDLVRTVKDPEHLWDRLQALAADAQNLQEVIEGCFQTPALRQLFTMIMRGYEGSEPELLDVASIDTLYQLWSHMRGKMAEADKGQTPTLSWLTVQGGNSQLPLALSQSLRNLIHYGHALTALHHRDQHITLQFNHVQEVHADIVLLALPCSVFKDVVWGDILPRETEERMSAIQYGSNAKMLVSVSKDQTASDFLISPTMGSWVNHSGDIRTFYYGGNEGIFEAPQAETMFERDLSILQIRYPHLHAVCGVPVPAQDISYTSYQTPVFKSWACDPYAKGSYTNCAPGTAAWLGEFETFKGEKVRKLFKPLYEKIFFAGEHTTTLDALGTMEGAIESGERMARLIDKTIWGD